MDKAVEAEEGLKPSENQAEEEGKERECAQIEWKGSGEKLTDGSAYMRAQAMAQYACAYFEAVKENARVNRIIAGIQQAAALYFADKQHDVAKQAQNRLDAQWENQRDKSDKLFNHWYDHARPEEIEQLGKASEREEKGYTVDYETAKNRVLADVRQEFALARQKLLREAHIHCTGATKVALRGLLADEARAGVAALNAAYRAEENRKDLKEAQYREELYKWLALFKGVVGESLNASKGAMAAAAAASRVNPYEGWQAAFGQLSNLGNAWNDGNTANTYYGIRGSFGSMFGMYGMPHEIPVNPYGRVGGNVSIRG